MLSNPILSPVPPHSPDISLILDTFSSFFQKTVSTHPKKSQMLTQLNSFLSFLSNNREDISKGYLYLKEMKSLQNSQQHEQKIEIALHNIKIADSQYHMIKDLNEFEFLQEMKTFNTDPKSFSYDLLLLLVSINYWDTLLSHIDKHQYNLLQVIKEKVFHDTLSQSIQEKILLFFEKIEEIAKSEQISYRRAFAKITTIEKTSDFLISMIPVIKQIIIKFLINSEWNFVREKLQDKLNTNSLNQIFTLFKNQTNFPQKDPEVQILEENTQNFLQILALGLNVNIKIYWNNSSLDGEKASMISKSFNAKNQDETIGNLTVFVMKQQNIWLYYNLYKNENSVLDENKDNTGVVSNKEFDSNKNFNNFFKSTSIKITEDMFPLNNINKHNNEENYNINKKKTQTAIKPSYLIEFLASFQEKTEEIYGRIFTNDENSSELSKKPNFKRYLSSELDTKTEGEETAFLSTNNKKTGEIFSAGIKTQQNNSNKMGFIQKCSKCPKEYVEYEMKKDNNYLCYICR